MQRVLWGMAWKAWQPLPCIPTCTAWRSKRPGDHHPIQHGRIHQNVRGLAVIVDDSMPAAAGVYTSILFGPGAVGYATTAPRVVKAPR